MLISTDGGLENKPDLVLTWKKISVGC